MTLLYYSCIYSAITSTPISFSTYAKYSFHIYINAFLQFTVFNALNLQVRKNPLQYTFGLFWFPHDLIKQETVGHTQICCQETLCVSYLCHFYIHRSRQITISIYLAFYSAKAVYSHSRKMCHTSSPPKPHLRYNPSGLSVFLHFPDTVTNFATFLILHNSSNTRKLPNPRLR